MVLDWIRLAGEGGVLRMYSVRSIRSRHRYYALCIVFRRLFGSRLQLLRHFWMHFFRVILYFVPCTPYLCSVW